MTIPPDRDVSEEGSIPPEAEEFVDEPVLTPWVRVKYNPTSGRLEVESWVRNSDDISTFVTHIEAHANQPMVDIIIRILQEENIEHIVQMLGV